MVRVEKKLLWNDLVEPLFDGDHILARRQTGTVRHPENMRVDGDGRVAEGDVEHHVGCLAAHAGQCLERLSAVRHLGSVVPDQDLAGANDIATIVGYLGQRPGAIYIDALGFAEEMQDIIALWGKPVSTSAT